MLPTVVLASALLCSVAGQACLTLYGIMDIKYLTDNMQKDPLSKCSCSSNVTSCLCLPIPSLCHVHSSVRLELTDGNKRHSTRRLTSNPFDATPRLQSHDNCTTPCFQEGLAQMANTTAITSFSLIFNRVKKTVEILKNNKCPYFSCEQPCNQTTTGNTLTFLNSLLGVFQKERMRGRV